MNLRSLLAIILINTTMLVHAMEYGLRFQAHDFTERERTSLTLGEKGYAFSDEIAIAFDLSFYKEISFGHILTIYGNDGTTVSLVSAAGENGFNPTLIINDEMHALNVPFDAPEEKPQNINLCIDRKNNEIVLTYEKRRYVFPYDLSKMKNARYVFGKTKEQTSIAPFDMQEIRLYTDRENNHRWELRTHEDTVTTDCISGVAATAENPYWLLEDHIFWKKIYTTKSKEQLQTAFDAKQDIFYIVGSSHITRFNTGDRSTSNIPVSIDGRMMRHSNYLTFDPITDRLLSYNLEKKIASTFDFSTEKWSTAEPCDDEPSHANHGFAISGQYAYTFGGYGFYKYNNDFFRIDLSSGDIAILNLSPLPDPRKSASLCVVGDKLYLFGGIGNPYGKQEMPTKRYYDLWEYDLSTGEGHCLWELDTVSCDYSPSLTMYYEPSDSCFYAATTLDGCAMMRIMRSRPSAEPVSAPVGDPMEEYRDCMFNLFRSESTKTYYLVIDKTYPDLSHDYAIYSICYPFADLSAAGLDTSPSESRNSGRTLIIISVIAALIAALIAAAVWLRRKKRQTSECQPIATHQNEVEAAISEENIKTTPSPEARVATRPERPAELPQHKNDFNTESREPKTIHFDRSRSSISLLGRFEVRDADGLDITPKFSMRIRDILIMLVLYTDKYEKGLNYKTLDENIWPEKDEKSAKNNRNVYMRKLRLLLEEVGDISISCIKGYYRITGDNTCIDYLELKPRLAKLDKNSDLDSEEFEKVLELLLHGPLLTNVKDEWLDSFKADFTDSSLRILNRILEQVYEARDYDLAYRIADIISLHDPLSEEALIVKCRILYAQRMNGPAKNVYDTFCKEYSSSFGEEFPTSFTEIIGKN